MIDFENGSVFKLRRNVQGVTGKRRISLFCPTPKYSCSQSKPLVFWILTANLNYTSAA